MKGRESAHPRTFALEGRNIPAKSKHAQKAPRQPGYCRHGNRAYTRVRGRWIHLGTYGTAESKALYDRTIAEYLANGREFLESGTVPETEPTPITVAELLVLYWEHAEKKYGKRRNAVKTLSHIKRALAPLRQHFGALAAESFGPAALEQLRDGYIAEGLSRNTVNDRVRIVKDVFSLAVRRQLVPLSLSHGLAEIKELQWDESDASEPVRVKPVPDEHVDAVLEHVLPPVKAMIELQRLTGMRPGEVTIMRGRDLDMNGPLWVYKPRSTTRRNVLATYGR